MVNPEFPWASALTGGSRGARAMTFISDGAFYNGCKSPSVWLKLKNRNIIHSSFSYLDRNSINELPPYPVVHDEFIGARIE